MNDTIRGGLALALVALVVMAVGSAVSLDTLAEAAVWALVIGVLTVAWGLLQGMTPKKDD